MQAADEANLSKPRLLQTIYPENFARQVTDQYRPYITLTYAQSMDGCIASKGGQQILLSGKESMLMTHWYVILGKVSIDKRK
jgi:2,5-diamino-6-(ribosylamino)-4(3H)-pyrimidinone 5'-phosphate reductase